MTSQSTQISDAMIGGNASAEEQAEELEEGAETGIDIVMNGRLQGTTYTKKDYQTYIKVCDVLEHIIVIWVLSFKAFYRCNLIIKYTCIIHQICCIFRDM